MHRIARYLCVAGLALASVSIAAAKQGRDFAGTYQLSNISEAGNSVHVTITLKVFNYSGADIRNSGVALFSSDANHEAIGAFAVVKLFPNFSLCHSRSGIHRPEDRISALAARRPPQLRICLAGS